MRCALKTNQYVQKAFPPVWLNKFKLLISGKPEPHYVTDEAGPECRRKTAPRASKGKSQVVTTPHAPTSPLHVHLLDFHTKAFIAKSLLMCPWEQNMLAHDIGQWWYLRTAFISPSNTYLEQQESQTLRCLFSQCLPHHVELWQQLAKPN